MPTGIVTDFDIEIGKIHSRVEALLPVLETVMKAETSKSVEKNVYPKYVPPDPNTLYWITRRFENGGMMDMRNYYTEIFNNDLKVTLENRTKGNPVWKPPVSEGWDSGEISDIIEAGVGYHWRGSNIYKMQPYPRPYLDEAEEKAAKAFEPALTDAYLST